ncbi:MAG: Crp/Fnr family transcriptional regulator [Clostridium sp.]
MDKYFNVINKVSLFKSLNDEEIKKALICLNPIVRSYKKGSFIINSGDRVTSFGIILEGSAIVFNEDVLGNRNILSKLKAGSLFGEVFACAKVDSSPVCVLAESDSKVMFIDYHKALFSCSNSCSCHNKIIENMVYIIANKNLHLTRKIEHISKRTIRDKIISYLSTQSIFHKSNNFKIPFNRQELADYLGVDRSALSKELSKMSEEGIVTYTKNHFQILI